MKFAVSMMRRFFIAFACAAALLFLLPSFALADEDRNTASATDLFVYAIYDAKGYSDLNVSIYRVADITSNNELAPVEPYSKYGIAWNASSDFELGALANTLEGYVLRDKPAPTASGVTDANGIIAFPKLDPGCYLILADRIAESTTYLDAVPVIVTVSPAHARSADFTIKVHLKFNALTNSGSTSLDVSKVWVGKDAKRPTDVQIQLLCDGEVLETVTLNGSNSWSHSWKNLSNAHVWRMVEAVVPDDYEVTAVNYGDTVTIRNTYVLPEEETPPSTPSVKPPAKLPQTGQLWWPVPALAGLGLMLLALGRLLKRRA